MTDTFPIARRIEHGAECDCNVLAQTLGLEGRAISYEYCRRVLQKRWRMTCHHGVPRAQEGRAACGDRWRELGPIDPVKAILISNEPSEA